MAAARARALLTVLRAPLLLSPVADSVAGWTLARWAARQDWGLQLADLGSAALAGCLLLAAGMAQNAVMDLDDDRLRKPERPLPRGDLSSGLVIFSCSALTLLALCVTAATPALLPAVGLIIVLTVAYHGGWKRRRLLGCLTLGTLRGTSMGLGVLAAASAAPGADSLLGCVLYGLYICGASLHASTDDEPGASRNSTLGLGLCQLCLLTVAIWLVAGSQQLSDLAGPALLLGAMLRLSRAARRLPSPAVTGQALSGLHLFHAGLVAGIGQPLVAMGILSLFAWGRWLLRFFPPS